MDITKTEKKSTEKEIGTDDIKDILQCSICLETLNEPVTLMCQHTFCRACLKGDIKKCPLCRTRMWLPPRKTINSTLKNVIIKTFGETAYNTMYNSREHSLLKSDLEDQVREELREELWRSVSEELPDGPSFVLDGDGDEYDSDNSDDEYDSKDANEEFKFDFRFNELNHTTYWIIIIILVLVIISLFI